MNIKELSKSILPLLLQLATHALYLPIHVLFTFIFYSAHSHRESSSSEPYSTILPAVRFISVTDGEPNSRKWLLLGGISIGISHKGGNAE